MHTSKRCKKFQNWNKLITKSCFPKLIFAIAHSVEIQKIIILHLFIRYGIFKGNYKFMFASSLAITPWESKSRPNIQSLNGVKCIRYCFLTVSVDTIANFLYYILWRNKLTLLQFTSCSPNECILIYNFIYNFYFLQLTLNSLAVIPMSTY